MGLGKLVRREREIPLADHERRSPRDEPDLRRTPLPSVELTIDAHAALQPSEPKATALASSMRLWLVYRRRSERRRVVVAGGVLAAALAACGSAYAVSWPHASNVALRTCQASQLTGSLVMSDGAGGRYSSKGTLEDVSKQKCTLDGYVHLVPLNSSGRPARIINAAGHLNNLTSSPLRPGESTYLLFHPPSQIR